MNKLIFFLPFFLFACGGEQTNKQPEIKPEVKKETAGKYFTQSDSARLDYCLCDSLYLMQNDSAFKGKGEAKLFTLKKRIAQCGLFMNYNLIYGLKFIYSANKDTLKTIQKYFKGNLTGEQKPSELKNFNSIDSSNNTSTARPRGEWSKKPYA